MNMCLNTFLKKYLSLFLISLLISFSKSGYAQTAETSPQIMTPEAASLGKFGSYPVGYYTGMTSVNIPLYTLSESSFMLNIGLQYDHSGFIPNKEPGVVGLNWNLIASGVVTRIVNGVPDDRYAPGTPSLLNGHVGYIYGMLNQNLGIYSKEYIRELDFLSFTTQNAPVTTIPYEYYPDVFSFNFNGHQGRFMLGNDGLVKVSSDRNYKVNLTNLTGQDDLCLCQNSEISITTDEGDEYIFGGDINTLEITYPYNPLTAPENSPGDRGIDCKAGVINAWHIKKVKLANGNEIDFNYELQNRDVFLFADDIHGISSGVDYAYEKIYFSDRFTQYFENGPQTSNSTGQNSRSLIKTCYLSNIVFTNGKIEFFYSVKSSPFYGSNHVVKNPNKPKQLDRIKISNTQETFNREIHFEYNDEGSAAMGFRQFLSQVNFKDQQDNLVNSYEFSYYKTNILPDPLTRGIDIWGYYNGKNTNSSLIPVVSSGPPDYNIDLTNRATDETFCDVGLLSKIEYPTGGWREFIYEGHDYGKVLRKQVAASFTPTWVIETGKVGGARIKEIGQSTGEIRKFYYLKNYLSDAEELGSSGILVDHNVFFTELEYYYNSTWGNIKYITLSDNNIGVGSTYAETPIAYSEITEVSSPGYTKYFYSTHETNPDVYSLGTDSYKYTPDPDASTNNFRNQLNRLTKYSSCDIERGKLIKTEVRNGNDQIVKEIVNEYNKDNLRYNESVMGFSAISPYFQTGYAIYHSNAFYCFQNSLTKQTVTENLDNGNVVTTIEDIIYLSNSNPLVRKKSYTNSRGQNISKEYKYPVDLQSAAIPNVYNEMITRHLVGRVVEEVGNNNTPPTSELSRTKTNFFLWSSGDIIKPENLQKSTSGDVLQNEIIMNNYDTKGNILQLAGRDGIPQSFQWGYNDTYPVVEIRNAQNSHDTYNDQPFSTSLALLTGSNEATATITTYTGTITLNLDAHPGKTYSLEYSLVGPVIRSGTLCASSSSTPCQSNHYQTATFNDMPAGVYTLYLYYYGADPDVFRRVSYNYPRRQIAVPGAKEFFYNGFENENGSNIASTNQFAGRKYYSGDYTVPYEGKSGRSYIVNYRYLDGSIWRNMTKPFVDNMTLTDGDAIDEVRVFPVDALMNSYTYDPLVGVTSHIDPSGKMIKYIYDGFGRLKEIRDSDGNILKTLDYQYQQPNNQ